MGPEQAGRIGYVGMLWVICLCSPLTPRRSHKGGCPLPTLPAHAQRMRKARPYQTATAHAEGTSSLRKMSQRAYAVWWLERRSMGGGRSVRPDRRTGHEHRRRCNPHVACLAPGVSSLLSSVSSDLRASRRSYSHRSGDSPGATYRPCVGGCCCLDRVSVLRVQPGRSLAWVRGLT
jgi:hypothetical protein